MNDFNLNPHRFTQIPQLGQVCRLGLATRGNTSLSAEAVETAIDRGVNYLNWCGHPDGMQDCIRGLGPQRDKVHIAVQLHARSADAARRELDQFLTDLNTDYIDIVTYYYVEHPDEWQQIIAPGGAAEAIEQAQAQGQVKSIGLTSHQRPLAATVAASGRVNLLMIRYNAAHRGAETDIFPTTTQHQIPVVAFTCLRWGALLRNTTADPPNFQPPLAADWYRFVLCQPAVAVVLMAPNGATELAADLTILDEWQGLSADTFASIIDHGERVHRQAGSFP